MNDPAPETVEALEPLADATPAEVPATDGIYSTCPICFAIAASGAGHEAWHSSRGEGMTDADHERA